MEPSKSCHNELSTHRNLNQSNTELNLSNELSTSDQLKSKKKRPNDPDNNEKLQKIQKIEIFKTCNTQNYRPNLPTIPENKRIMKYTTSELRERKKHFGSTLSLFDRKKFEKEFDVTSLELTQEEQKIYRDNPHIRQVFANKREFRKLNRPFMESDRYATETSGRLKYARRIGEAKTVEHWGQRKLLLSEVEFLTLFAEEGYTVIYAGAAPGTHTNYLSKEMFPQVRFILVDPARFDAQKTDKIEIRQELFTDNLAKELFEKYDKRLFISDIRSMSYNMSDKDKEERVVIDMKAQIEWHQILKPKASMLKFRLPYHTALILLKI